MKQNKIKGLTLIEVIIALGMFAIVSIGIISSLEFYARYIGTVVNKTNDYFIEAQNLDDSENYLRKAIVLNEEIKNTHKGKSLDLFTGTDFAIKEVEYYIVRSKDHRRELSKINPGVSGVAERDKAKTPDEFFKFFTKSNFYDFDSATNSGQTKINSFPIDEIIKPEAMSLLSTKIITEPETMGLFFSKEKAQPELMSFHSGIGYASGDLKDYSKDLECLLEVGDRVVTNTFTVDYPDLPDFYDRKNDQLFFTYLGLEEQISSISNSQKYEYTASVKGENIEDYNPYGSNKPEIKWYLHTSYGSEYNTKAYIPYVESNGGFEENSVFANDMYVSGVFPQFDISIPEIDRHDNVDVPFIELEVGNFYTPDGFTSTLDFRDLPIPRKVEGKTKGNMADYLGQYIIPVYYPEGYTSVNSKGYTGKPVYIQATRAENLVVHLDPNYIAADRKIIRNSYAFENNALFVQDSEPKAVEYPNLVRLATAPLRSNTSVFKNSEGTSKTPSLVSGNAIGDSTRSLKYLNFEAGQYLDFAMDSIDRERIYIDVLEVITGYAKADGDVVDEIFGFEKNEYGTSMSLSSEGIFWGPNGFTNDLKKNVLGKTYFTYKPKSTSNVTMSWYSNQLIHEMTYPYNPQSGIKFMVGSRSNTSDFLLQEILLVSYYSDKGEYMKESSDYFYSVDNETMLSNRRDFLKYKAMDK